MTETNLEFETVYARTCILYATLLYRAQNNALKYTHKGAHAKATAMSVDKHCKPTLNTIKSGV